MTAFNFHFPVLFMCPRVQATERHLDKSVLSNFLGPTQPHQLSLSPPVICFKSPHTHSHTHTLPPFISLRKRDQTKQTKDHMQTDDPGQE